MIVVGIETATPHGGIAVMDEHRLLGSMTLRSGRGLSRFALASLEQILAEAGIDRHAIDAVAVSIGPGSFTGVRVGLALALGMCESGRPSLVTVSTLEALARRAWAGEDVEQVLPLLDARRGEVYGAFFGIADSRVGPQIGDAFAHPPEAVAEHITARTLLAGEGYLVSRESFASTSGIVLARPERFHPSAEQVAAIGLERAQRGEWTSPEEARPVYLRDVSARPSTRT